MLKKGVHLQKKEISGSKFITYIFNSHMESHCKDAKKYDFDQVIDRHGTHAMKYDSLKELFGRDDLTPLWIADMDFAVCPEICKAIDERAAHHVFGYSEAGEDYWNSIIDWLERRHGFKVSREELAFVPGVVRGIAYAVNYFTRPGDKIVIQPPVYHPFRIVAEGNGREVIENPLVVGDDEWFYKMDLEGLERIFATEQPRMLILCNPHNPVGLQWDEETLRRVASLARRYGVIVISDEIHGDLMLYGRRHVPFASVSEDAAAVSVSFGAPSKTFNIPGLVSSWMVVKNPELRSGFYHWMEVNEFSSPFFTATVATEAAYKNGENWLNELLEYIEGNIAAVADYLHDNLPEIKPIRPQASFLIWLDCRALGLTQKQLEDRFINEAGLALNSGTMFGSQGKGFMRLNVAMPRCELLKAIEKLKKLHKEV